ncbi:MAG: NADH-quinone oxidoreductase subunit NuoE [Acidobacteriota bacterium]
MLSDKARSQVRSLMEKYPAPRSAIMPALHLAQRECGWLPDEAVQDLSELMGLSTTEINSVATFYTMYARDKRGEHTIYFCTDLPCALRGADELMEHIEHKLGCKAGETTANGKVTLKDAECLGGCDHAPVMLIDGEEHAQDLTPENVDQILDRLTK